MHHYQIQLSDGITLIREASSMWGAIHLASEYLDSFGNKKALVKVLDVRRMDTSPLRMNLQVILAKHAQWLKDSNTGQRADLQGANLQEANLQEANLQKANLREVDLRKVDLRRANLQKANLQEANLQEANLQEVDLRKANLRRANLQKANLHNANLQEANLREVDLRGVILCDCNLDGAFVTYRDNTVRINFTKVEESSA